MERAKAAIGGRDEAEPIVSVFDPDDIDLGDPDFDEDDWVPEAEVAVPSGEQVSLTITLEKEGQRAKD